MCQNDSDIIGVLHFFRSIHSRKVNGVSAGIRKMLPLILASEPVQREVLSLFHFLFVQDKSPQQAALNLVECCADLTLADHASMTMVIHRLVKPTSSNDTSSRIPVAVFDALRKFTCFKLPTRDIDVSEGEQKACSNTNALEAINRRQRYALCLLAMAAEVIPNKIFGNPKHIAKLGAAVFGEAGAANTADANNMESLDIGKIQFMFRMLRFVPKAQRSSTPVKLLLTKAYQFLEWKNCAITEAVEIEWYAAAEWAVNAIFALTDRPVASFGVFMRQLASRTFTSSITKDSAANMEVHTLSSKNNASLSSSRLSHFLFLLGQFSIKIVVLAEDLTAQVKKNRVEFQKRPKTVEGDSDEVRQQRIEEVNEFHFIWTDKLNKIKTLYLFENSFSCCRKWVSMLPKKSQKMVS